MSKTWHLAPGSSRCRKDADTGVYWWSTAAGAMTDSTETRECQGGGRKAGRAFQKTHARTRLEADAVWLRKSCVEEEWATEGTRGPVCAVTASMWGGCRGRWDWSGGQRLAHFPELGHPELCSEDQCVLQGARLSARGKPGFNFQRLVFKFIFFSEPWWVLKCKKSNPCFI